MGSRWSAVVVDAADPARLARWWAEVLDYRILDEEDGEVRIGIPVSLGGPAASVASPALLFISADDAKVGNNRLHLDLHPDDRDSEVERLVNMGARHVDVGQQTVSWVVLADPEGNEFCVLRAGAVAA